MRKSIKGLHLSCALVAILVSMPALGQETDNSAATDDQSNDDPFGAIVVTADRRASSVQDIPIAISAFSGDQLQVRGITNVEQLSDITPSLEVYAEQVNNEHYTIRGIGDSNEDLTTDSGVAVYLNDVYLARPGEANAGIFDVERVEVLRGPQGTLYGKNAVGGVVNIITRKPTQELDGEIILEAGGLGHRRISAGVGAGLTDRIAARIAGYSLQTSGAYRNLTTGERANGIDTQAMRGSLSFDSGGPLTVDFVADYVDARQDGVLKSVIVDTPGDLFILKDFYAEPYPTQEDDIRSGRSNNNGEQGVKHWGLSMHADYATAGGIISLISGYRDEESFNFEDIDRTAKQINDFYADQDTWATSQELRFVSAEEGPLSAGGRLKFATGLYWFHEQGNRDQYIDLNGRAPGTDPDFDDPDNGLLGPGTPDAQNSTASFLQAIKTDSYAAYGEMSYDITKQITLTLGARYTIEKKRVSIEANSVANEDGPDLGDYSLFLSEGPFAGSNSETWKKFTPKAVIEFQPSADLNIYASYARGFKSGGFNGQAATIGDLDPFLPEAADNFEIGFKSELFNRLLRLNASAFYVDFTDLQVAGTNELGQIVTGNAADAQIKGLELEATLRPFKNFSINGGYSYLHAVYKDYFVEIFDPSVMDGPPFRLISLEDKQLNGVPRHAGSVSFSYDIDLDGGSYVRLGGDAIFRGKTYTSEDTFRSPSYSVYNARVSWTSADDRWEVAGWVKNITDKVYYRGGGAIPDFGRDTGRIGLVGDPRSAGATVRLRFGG